MKNNPVLLLALLLLPLSSCFTGVESTPKITLSDVRRENAAATTPEAQLMASLGVDSLESWHLGKRFIVVDDRATRIFTPRLDAEEAIRAGIILSFDSIATGTSITGAPDVTLYFTTPDDRRLGYRTNRPDGPSLSIPFTVDLDLVSRARDLLKGRHLWVTTAIWRNAADEVTGGLKYVPVVINEVNPGTGDYPIRVEFTTETIDPERTGMLFVTPDIQGAGSRRFETQFSLSDPRRQYPDITDEAWELIRRGLVHRGMTREECRLSLGAPRDIDRRAGYSSVRETWLYENGIYLIFSDGVLIDFRK